MQIFPIDAGNFKLDGGAMFGVVPKTLWSKKVPADDLNLCSWKMRCLLIQDGPKLILIDTGMGNKQAEKWLAYYYRHGEGDLIQNIRGAGFHEDQITDVLLSHLHFDHAGGAVSWNKAKTDYIPTFKNAKYWTHSDHWNWATQPNAREKATFLKENLWPLHQHQQLHFIDDHENPLGAKLELLLANGHTEKMIMPLIHCKGNKILFVADTIPSHAHIHIPYVMGYDIRPLETMKEKEDILKKAIKNDWLLYFDHDPYFEVSKVWENEKGFRPEDEGMLSDYLTN